MKKLLILDSNSIINRAFYGIKRYLSAPDGTPTAAIYGFLNILFKLINDEKPDYVCGAFDLKAPTFRHKMYAEYKAGRRPMPDDLKAQMPIAREILKSMDIPVLEFEGYEADDIIGTVSRICDQSGIKCLIATGDKDDLQLVSENTNVILTVSRSGESETVCYGIDEVRERYGVTPSEFIDIKALMGDQSDNIPGVKGIGEKGAMKYIGEFHSIEALYENLDASGIKGAALEKLKAGKESAFMSKTLATICTKVPIDFNSEDCTFDFGALAEKKEFIAVLERLGLNSFIKKLGASNGKNKTFFDKMVICADIPENIRECACTLEFDGGELVGACICSGNDVFWAKGSEKEIIEKISPVLENETIPKYMFDCKEHLVKLKNKVEIKNLKADIEIGAYLINPSKSSYTIFGLLDEMLGVEPPQTEANVQMSLFDDVPENDTLAKCAFSIIPLWKEIEKRLEEKGLMKLFSDMEMPLVSVLADMEYEGFKVDTGELCRFGNYLSESADKIKEEIYELCGEEFNINSPKQLGVVLFEKLGLKPAKKTKTGYATGAEVLEKLRGKHPVTELILKYRQLMKLKSTYCDGLLAVADKATGKIHTVFNQTVTVTGRLSSAEPNLQNIPVRTELGRELRKMFIASSDDNILLDADYSQIELRILAHMSDDTVMKNAFINGEDVHAVTASQVFDVPLCEVTPEQRSFAKTVNFGIVYGMGEFSLAQDLKISVKEAKSYISQYWEKYSGVHDFMETTRENAKKYGYVKTLFGRMRYLPELKSPNYNIRSFGERAASNAPIQGTAADIIKIAMIRVHDRLKKEKLKAKLIMQVHDELILELPKNELESAKKLLREEMEGAAALSVPLKVEMAEGRSWYDAK